MDTLENFKPKMSSNISTLVSPIVKSASSEYPIRKNSKGVDDDFMDSINDEVKKCKSKRNPIEVEVVEFHSNSSEFEEVESECVDRIQDNETNIIEKYKKLVENSECDPDLQEILNNLEKFRGDEPFASKIIKQITICNRPFTYVPSHVAIDGDNILGLEFMLEIRRDEGMNVLNCSYYCSICKEYFTPLFFARHVTSGRHRGHYTRVVFPSLYEKIGKFNWSDSKIPDPYLEYYAKIKAVIGPIFICVAAEKSKKRATMLLKKKFDKLEHLWYYDKIKFRGKTAEKSDLGHFTPEHLSILDDKEESNMLNEPMEISSMPENEQRIEKCDEESYSVILNKLEKYYQQKPFASEIFHDLTLRDHLTIIGQEFMIEICPAGADEFMHCSYFCVPCNNFISPIYLGPHVVGAQHKRCYMKKVFPTLHEYIYPDSLDVSDHRTSEMVKFYGKIKSVRGNVVMAVTSPEDLDEVKDLFRMKLNNSTFISYYDAVKIDDNLKEICNFEANDDTGENIWAQQKVLMLRRNYLKKEGFDGVPGIPNVTYEYLDSECDVTSVTFEDNFDKYSLYKYNIIILSPYDWVMDRKYFMLHGVESFEQRKKHIKYQSVWMDKMKNMGEAIRNVNVHLTRKYRNLKVIWTLPHPIDYRCSDFYSFDPIVTTGQFCTCLELMSDWFRMNSQLRVVCMTDVVVNKDEYGTFLNENYKEKPIFLDVIKGDRVGMGWTEKMKIILWEKVKEMWGMKNGDVHLFHIERRKSKIMTETSTTGVDRSCHQFRTHLGAYIHLKADEFKSMKMDSTFFNYNMLFTYYWKVGRLMKDGVISDIENLAKRKRTSYPRVTHKHLHKKHKEDVFKPCSNRHACNSDGFQKNSQNPISPSNIPTVGSRLSLDNMPEPNYNMGVCHNFENNRIGPNYNTSDYKSAGDTSANFRHQALDIPH